MRKFETIVLIGTGTALAIACLFSCRKPASPALTTRPSESPTTTTVPTTEPAIVLGDYDALLKKRFPDLATTQPLSTRLPAAESAHLQLNQPVYCDSVGELWITDPLAPPLAETIANASKTSTHMVADDVLYVHRAPNANGEWEPQVIVKTAAGAAWQIGNKKLLLADANDFIWSDAISWNNRILVPTRDGVASLAASQTVQTQRLRFASSAAGGTAKVQLVADSRGILAWQACDDPNVTEAGAARYVDGKWETLTDWPTNLIQLVPLLDGGVLTVSRDDEKNALIQTHYLDVATADESRVEVLIDQLSDPSAETREQATNELARWGASAWPILEKAQADQLPEAQARIARLLENRTHPDLLGFRLLPGPVRVVARRGGSVMIAAERGVTFQREADSAPVKVSPAVLLIDQRGVQLAPQGLSEAAMSLDNFVDVCGSEWFVSSATLGPRWWIANHFSDPLLRKPERSMMRVAGLDSSGRILLRENLTDAAPTLLIDPSLPDQTPRLPVWVRVIDNGSTGWTEDNWPAMRFGGVWALNEDHWKPIDEKQMLAELPAPTTAPSTQPACLLTDSRGTQYVLNADGARVVLKSGKSAKWTIDRSVVDTPLQIFETAGHLFVVGDPGQLLRYNLPTETQPVPTLNATFTRRLPTSKPRRVWVDPAGRINFAYDDNGLAICFPSGRIPSHFAEMMTAEDLRQANEAADPTTQP